MLRNETLPSYFSRNFLYYLVKYSNTDNGEAVSILLEDGRCNVDIDMLEKMLRRGFTAMAMGVRGDDRVTKDITMCHTCSNYIGFHDCASYSECIISEDKRKYCRECVLKDDCFCKECSEYICPTCVEEENCQPCEKCGGLECNSVCLGHFLIKCDQCNRHKCKACCFCP